MRNCAAITVKSMQKFKEKKDEEKREKLGKIIDIKGNSHKI